MEHWMNLGAFRKIQTIRNLSNLLCYLQWFKKLHSKFIIPAKQGKVLSIRLKLHKDLISHLKLKFKMFQISIALHSHLSPKEVALQL